MCSFVVLWELLSYFRVEKCGEAFLLEWLRVVLSVGWFHLFFCLSHEILDHWLHGFGISLDAFGSLARFCGAL